MSLIQPAPVNKQMLLCFISSFPRSIYHIKRSNMSAMNIPDKYPLPSCIVKNTKYKHWREFKAGGGIFSRYNNPCTAILLKHIYIYYNPNHTVESFQRLKTFEGYITLNSFLVLLGVLMVYAFCSYYSTVKCNISHLRIVLSRQSPFLSILIRSEFTNLL